MDICVLSNTETARLEQYDIAPCCAHHQHVKPCEALALIQGDTHRAVTSRSITEQASNNRVWRGRNSGGVKVLQLVRPFIG